MPTTAISPAKGNLYVIFWTPFTHEAQKKASKHIQNNCQFIVEGNPILRILVDVATSPLKALVHNVETERTQSIDIGTSPIKLDEQKKAQVADIATSSIKEGK